MLTVLRFGIFEFDPAAPELRRSGRRVHLQEMPLRVLGILLEAPNKLVTRETLFARLWPNDELGILDDNLNTAIRKLRLALDDSAHQPRFIETVPKRGYRFVAPLLTDEPRETAVALADSQDTPSSPIPTHRRFVHAMAIVATIVVAALGVWWLLKPGRETTISAPAASSGTTLAILPFVNASGNPNDEYFSDGLAEELMDRLSRTDRLRVVSRTSAFSLKGKDIGAREIGRLLGATSLVEGSVRRDGDRLRISVRLVNAQDGYQLWSETYDRRMRDVFQVQEDIALSIANTLTGRLLGTASTNAKPVPAIDPAALDAYLKGRFDWHRRTEQSLRSAAAHLEQAVARAPHYAAGWAGLADAYAVLGFYDYLPPSEAFPKAQQAAVRALELDAENASAHATLGYVALYYDWNLVTAEARFRDAIARDPNLSKTHQWYGNLLTAAGRFADAEQEMRRAQQLDPLSLIASAALGWTLYYAGQHEQALAQYRRTLALDSNFELAYLWSGWALEALGKYDEALAMFKESVRRSGGNAISTASLARLYALRGEREEAKRIIQPLVASKSYVPAYEISKVWFALGATEQAEEWLQRAYEQRSHSMMFLKVDPQFSAYRDDAGFVRITGLVAQAHR